MKKEILGIKKGAMKRLIFTAFLAIVFAVLAGYFGASNARNVLDSVQSPDYPVIGI